MRRSILGLSLDSKQGERQPQADYYLGHLKRFEQQASIAFAGLSPELIGG